MASFTFTWTVENFSVNVKKLVSPTFYIENFGGNEWFLDTSPIQDNSKTVFCYLNKIATDADIALNIKSELKIFGSGVKPFLTCFLENKFSNKSKYHAFEIFSFSSLFDMKKISTFTFQLHITSLQFFNTFYAHCFASTIYGINQYSFLWRTEDCESTVSNVTQLLKNAQIELEITLLVEEIKISLRNKLDIERFVCAKLSLMDIEGKEIFSKTDSNLFEKIDSEWLFPTFIEKNFLAENGSKNLNDGKFSLRFEFFVPNGAKLEILRYEPMQSKSYTSSHKDKSLDVLRSSYEKMFTDRILSDIKFQIGDETIMAHKCVLSARSPIFHAMFRQDMLENQSGVIDVDDVDSQTFTSFLRFLYMGDAGDMDWELALKLMMISDKYQVDTLKEECSSFLSSHLSETNVCEILRAADLLSLTFLKKSVFRFIKSNTVKILSSAEWGKVIEENVKLASEVVVQMSSDLCKSFDVFG